MKNLLIATILLTMILACSCESVWKDATSSEDVSDEETVTKSGSVSSDAQETPPVSEPAVSSAAEDSDYITETSSADTTDTLSDEEIHETIDRDLLVLMDNVSELPFGNNMTDAQREALDEIASFGEKALPYLEEYTVLPDEKTQGKDVYRCVAARAAAIASRSSLDRIIIHSSFCFLHLYFFKKIFEKTARSQTFSRVKSHL